MKRHFQVTVNGDTYIVEVEEKKSPAAYLQPVEINYSQTNTPPVQIPHHKAATSPHNYTVRAPLPGKVIEVKVKTGQRLTVGEVMVIIEAMKMENEITAPVHGTVKEVLVHAGSNVTSGQPLLVIG
ncbi:MAG: acetyl-CoA carboxylase biotin carboxyl carrier protein subunit [Clostridia bacterium]|nr:acetyl-CoA carboxylase biotin carboxyl carrier protein subunit [Clostridia bacterium]